MISVSFFPFTISSKTHIFISLSKPSFSCDGERGGREREEGGREGGRERGRERREEERGGREGGREGERKREEGGEGIKGLRKMKTDAKPVYVLHVSLSTCTFHPTIRAIADPLNDKR